MGSSQGHWEFHSAGDVSRFWNDNRNVPDRAEGREHYHEERYCLGLYLLGLATHGKLTYPFLISQFEEHVSPDFMIRWRSGEMTGLEVTRATDEELQKKKTAAHKEYRRRKNEAASSGAESEPVTIPLTTAGWLNGEREKGWCSLFQKAVEKKLRKLQGEAPEFHSGFRAATNYELLVYDDSPFIGVDRATILATIHQWIRSLPKEKPAFRRISIIASLDVIFDIGGKRRMFPYVQWSDINPGDPKSLMVAAHRVEEAGQAAVQRAIQKNSDMGIAVHFTDSRGRLIKQMPDGRQFELKVLDSGEEVIVREL